LFSLFLLTFTDYGTFVFSTKQNKPGQFEQVFQIKIKFFLEDPGLSECGRWSME
jgi:hypothetical protein